MAAVRLGAKMEPIPLVSTCLIVRDEANNLRRCLSSLSGLADEIVVVDTGSTDGTPELAESLGARVFHQAWTGDFSFHRNHALDQARGRWIHVLDADEEVVETDFEETRFHLQNVELPPVLLVREILRYPSRSDVVVALPRIFRREEGYRYVFPIHEQLDVSGTRAAMSNVRVLHHGYETAESLRQKEARNLEIALGMPDSPHAYHCRARAGFSLERWELVVDSARAMSQCGQSPTVATEACVLGGAAATRLGDFVTAREMVSRAEALLPEAPDVRFLNLLVAAEEYLESLKDGDMTTPGTILRSPMFWHDRRTAKTLLDVLSGGTGLRNQSSGDSGVEAGVSEGLTDKACSSAGIATEKGEQNGLEIN